MKNHTISPGFVRTPTPRYDVVIRTTSHAVCVKVRALATIVFSDHFGNCRNFAIASSSSLIIAWCLRNTAGAPPPDHSI
jgi:hypothetical protein